MVWLDRLLRIPLGMLFVAAGVVKMIYLPDFIVAVGEFGVVPDSLVAFSAGSICIAEILAGLGVALGSRIGPVALGMLLVVFMTVLAYGIYLGLDIDCGCLGPDYHVSLSTQLLIDVGLIAWCGACCWTGQSVRRSTQQVTRDEN